MTKAERKLAALRMACDAFGCDFDSTGHCTRCNTYDLMFDKGFAWQPSTAAQRREHHAHRSMRWITTINGVTLLRNKRSVFYDRGANGTMQAQPRRDVHQTLDDVALNVAKGVKDGLY